MEKLVCSGCGAALTPNIHQPYLVCEYCDTALPNAFYVEPEEPEAVVSAPTQEAAQAETVVQEAEEETSDPLSSFVETVGGVARTLLQRSLINRSLQRSVKQRPVIQRTFARPVVQQMRTERPQSRPPQPRMQHPHGVRQPHAGGPGRPTGRRPAGGPGGRSSMGGPGRGRK